MSTFKVLVLIALLGVLVNFLNDPLPDDLPGWWQTKLWLAMFRIVFVMPSIGSKLGLDGSKLVQTGLRIVGNVIPRSMAEGVTVTDGSFDGVPVSIYRPSAEQQTGRGVLFLHGGGWVIGEQGVYIDQLSRMAKELGATLVYPHYRRAPKHPFPAAANDCIASYKYFVDNAEKFNVDPTRIAVVGESAGGNLAAVVSLDSLYTGFLPKPKLQVLLYPVLQGSNLHTPSYEANKDGPFQTAKTMGFFFAAYLFGTDYEKYEALILDNQHTSPEEKRLNAKEHMNLDVLPRDKLRENYKENLDTGNSSLWKEIRDKFRNPMFAPLFGENLTGLTPAYINTCQYDVLRDDGYFYAKRLGDAKVKVKHHNFLCLHTWPLLSFCINEYYDEFTKVLNYIEENT